MPQLTSKKFKKVFVPDDPTKAFVELVYLKPGQRASIDAACNQILGSEGADGEMQTTIEFNTQRKRKLWLEAAIHSWGGFVDEKGKETKPTPKNIRMFDAEMKDLYDWLSGEMDEFIAEIEGEEEPAQEN